MKLFNVEPETACCQNCAHFYQHYVQNPYRRGYASPIGTGHCAYPRIKFQHIDDVCDKFTPKTPWTPTPWNIQMKEES